MSTLGGNEIMLLFGVPLSFGRWIYYQSRIKSGKIVFPFVDPMPGPRLFHETWTTRGHTVQDSLITGRLWISAAYLLMIWVVCVAVALFSAWWLVLILAAELLCHLVVDWYQWFSVDLGLMSAKWGWWLRDTQSPA